MAGAGLVEILDILRRRWGILFATIVALTSLTAIVLFSVTPRYTAESLIMIGSRGINLPDLQAVVSGLSADAETIEGEIEIISSRGLAEKVIAKLKLEGDPEFHERPAKPDYKADPVARTRLIDAFRKRLDVAQKGRSRIISVAFTSEDRQKAALVANTIAELYVLEQLEAKFEGTRRATSWLNERINILREKVETSETAIERFRQKSGLLQTKETTVVAQQLSELNTQLILAKAARAEAEARLNQLQTLINGPDGVESAGDVLRSELIQSLRASEADIQRKLAELSTEYGERHPKMVNLRAETRSLQRKIETEVTKIAKGLENEVAIAQAREASLQTSLNGVKEKVAKSNQHMVQLRALEREAEANRALLKTFLSRVKETSFQQDMDIQEADARIVSQAHVPDKPSFPKKLPIFALAILGSSVIGLILIFVIERLEQGFRSGEEIERLTGVRSLGLVPQLNNASAAGRSPASYLLDHPKSAFGESINTLRWSIDLSCPDGPPRRILITSTQPKEGKTTIASCLAVMEARAGRKVLIIDADCRMPSLHDVFKVNRIPGLVEALSGELPIDQVIQMDKETNVAVIGAGSSTPNPTDIFASEQMDQLLDALAKDYDVVILDSPPVMVANDVFILSQKADATVFVIRWANTRRAAASRALQQVAQSNTHLAGALLSMVDLKKHSRYRYGDSGYYYGPMERYYTE